MRVRPSGPEDVPAITAIYADAVLHGTATFELDPPDEAEMAARRTALLRSRFPFLVLDQDGTVAGYAYSGPFRTRPAYDWTAETSIYLDGRFRGRGGGKLLLAALVDETARRGCRQLVAVIGDSANAGSIRLHAALGFAHVGVLRSTGWKHGRWLDTVLMQRALGEGDATGAPDRTSHP